MPRPTQRFVPATPEMIRDAGRWNALMHSAILYSVGWAGFDPESPSRKGKPDTGFRHLTMDFNTQKPGEDIGTRATTHNRCADMLTELADIIRTDIDSHIEVIVPMFPEIDYEEAFRNLVNVMRDRKLQMVGKSDPESRACYHLLQMLLVKHGDDAAIRGPMFINREDPTHAEP